MRRRGEMLVSIVAPTAPSSSAPERNFVSQIFGDPKVYLSFLSFLLFFFGFISQLTFFGVFEIPYFTYAGSTDYIASSIQYVIWCVIGTFILLVICATVIIIVF